MSGGRWNYQDSSLQNEIFGYTDSPINVFEDIEISELVWDVFGLLHDFDLYESCDTGEDTWLKQKNAFKRKYFGTPRKDRLKKIIDQKAEEFKIEMYKTIGIKFEDDEDG